MLTFLLKRFLWALPAFALLSGLLFGLQKVASETETAERLDWPTWWAAEVQQATNLGQNQPSFYLSFTPPFYPDTLYHWPMPAEKKVLESWLYTTGNWSKVVAYRAALSQLSPKPLIADLQWRLRLQPDLTTHATFLQQISNIDAAFGAVLQAAYTDLIQQKPLWGVLLWPQIRVHGRKNQYHAWLVHTIQGDWQQSTLGLLPAQAWWPPLSISLVLGLISLLLAYVVGIFAAYIFFLYRKSKYVAYLQHTTLAVYALPTFVWAAACVVFFTTPEYGLKWTNIGLIDDFLGQKTVYERLWQSRDRLILPIFCLVLHPTIVVMRYVFNAFEADITLPFVQAARAKGLSEATILRRHLAKRAIFSLVALAIQQVPRLLLGTWVVEAAFNLPGFGALLLEAVWAHEGALLSSFLLYTAALTYIFATMSQIFYRFLHPQMPFLS